MPLKSPDEVEHSSRGYVYLERRVERPEGVIKGVRVLLTASGGQDQHKLSGKGVLLDEIEEVLEQAGV